MKKTKLMLTILLALSLLIASAGAALAAGASGKCGDNLTWTLSEDGTLTVSGEGPMKTYSHYPWETAGEIRSVVVESGVTTVADRAFWQQPGLKTVTLADSVTSVGNYVFYEDAALEEKQREADANLSEEQRQYNQKVAISYVTDILKNGQMPTNELLVAAGLSYEDAQKLMAVISAGGGSGNGGDEEGNGENIWRPAVEASASAGATTALQNDSAAYQAALAAMNLGTTAGSATSAATSAATKKGSTTQKKTGTNAAANALAALGYNTEANILKSGQTAKKLTNDQSDANKKNKGFSKSSGN